MIYHRHQAFASPLIYAALGVIPIFIFNQEKELSVKGLIIRRVAELAVIETIFMGIAFAADTIPTEKKGVLIGIAVGIIVVYGLTFLFEYVFESMESKLINEDLFSYQKKQENSCF